ncbi:MAG TPA: DUF5362 family protein [Bacteroidales bacterium]|nr:DUF5362 family protein [Bacteroidales bacterium]
MNTTNPDESDENPSEFYENAHILQTTVARMTRDMKFVSIFIILYGVLYSLTIIGAIFGIPMIISGIRLKDSADSYNTFIHGNDNTFLLRAFSHQQKFFFITKVLIILAILLLLLYVFSIYWLFNNMFDMMHQFNGTTV